jgi:hypothetical protein
MKDIQVFVDLDGVMADFEEGVRIMTGKYPHEQESRNKMWKQIGASNTFFQDLPIMPDAMRMWNYLQQYKPIVLTATGHRNPMGVDAQKRRWVAKNLGTDIRVLTVEHSNEKAKYAHERAILIDDRTKSIEPWIEAGGKGILHISVPQTLTQFPRIMEDLQNSEIKNPENGDDYDQENDTTKVSM